MNELTTLDLNNLGNTPLIRRLNQVRRTNAAPLMVSWMKILDDGNRRGILAGLDGKGVPLTPVKYRPVGPKKHQIKARKRGRGAFQGIGASMPTSEEYRRMTGPPLAPRGVNSRVITNFAVDYAQLRINVWQVTYWWHDVVSKRGVPFLGFHFRGATGGGRRHNVTLPVRDLRGVRPDDQAKIQRALQAWMEEQVRINS